MEDRLLSLLVCPVCKGELEYHLDDKELICLKDQLAFAVRDGVPVLIEMDARKLTSSVD